MPSLCRSRLSDRSLQLRQRANRAVFEQPSRLHFLRHPPRISYSCRLSPLLYIRRLWLVLVLACCVLSIILLLLPVLPDQFLPVLAFIRLRPVVDWSKSDRAGSF